MPRESYMLFRGNFFGVFSIRRGGCETRRKEEYYVN